MNGITLCNMDKGEWASVMGDEHWRSDRIYQCEICGCHSNEFYMWGGPSTGRHPKLVCPGDKFDSNLHYELQNKVWNSWDKKHPQGYLEMLNEEIEEARKQFLKVESNVVENPRPVDPESPVW